MNRHRLFLFLILTLAFVGVSLLFFTNVWKDAATRFRSGLPVPKNILPPELLRPEDIIPKGPPQAPVIRPGDPLLWGNASSAVTLIVFGDFQCEYCRDQARALEDALRLTDRPNGVRAVWRDLPLINKHPRSFAAAAAAACAARQGKFKPMHDALFFRATDLSDTELLALARDADLNLDDYTVCLRDPAVTFRLMRDLEDARKLAITSVPLIFVDGRPLDGLLDSQTLTAVIRKALADKPAR